MGCNGGGGGGGGGGQHCWDKARGTRTRLRAQVTRLGVQRQSTAGPRQGLHAQGRVRRQGAEAGHDKGVEGG